MLQIPETSFYCSPYIHWKNIILQTVNGKDEAGKGVQSAPPSPSARIRATWAACHLCGTVATVSAWSQQSRSKHDLCYQPAWPHSGIYRYMCRLRHNECKCTFICVEWIQHIRNLDTVCGVSLLNIWSGNTADNRPHWKNTARNLCLSPSLDVSAEIISHDCSELVARGISYRTLAATAKVISLLLIWEQKTKDMNSSHNLQHWMNCGCTMAAIKHDLRIIDRNRGRGVHFEWLVLWQ